MARFLMASRKLEPGAAPGHNAVVPSGLCERADEMAALATRYQQATAGRGGVVLLSGEAGMGKTSLVDHFAASVRGGPAPPSAFLVGRCDDLHTPTPLGAVHDLAMLAPEPARSAVLASRDAATATTALVDLARASPAPVVLVVEDVHWADDATLDTIRRLWRWVGQASALLVVTYRDEDLSYRHPARRLLGSMVGPGVARLRLGPLTESAVRSLAAGTAVDAAELTRVTGGNPFFVTEVLGASGDEVPPTVRDAVLGRLAALSPAARAVVAALSVVPSRCERWLADALADAVADTSTAGMAEAERAGVLQGDSEAVWFRHELARRAVEAAQTAAERVRHHRVVLRELVRRDPEPARLVHHASRAGDRDTLLRHAAAAAAQAVSAGSHRQASAHFALLLEDADRLDPRQVAEYRAGWAYSLYVINEFGAATRVGEAAVTSWERAEDLRGLGSALVTFSMAAFWTRGPTAAAVAAERAIAVFDQLGDVAGLAHSYTALARAHSNLATLGSVAEPCHTGLQLAHRAVELADRVQQDDLRSIALIYRGSSRLALGDAGGSDDLTEALRLTEADPRAEYYMRACVQAAGSAHRDSRIDAALQYVELGLRRGHDAEFFAGEYRLRLTQASALATAGRWSESMLTLRRLLADQRADAGLMRQLAQSLLARLLARRDRPAEAAALLAEARPGPGADIVVVGPWAIAAVEVAWLAGAPEAAGGGRPGRVPARPGPGPPRDHGRARLLLPPSRAPRRPTGRASRAVAGRPGRRPGRRRAGVGRPRRPVRAGPRAGVLVGARRRVPGSGSARCAGCAGGREDRPPPAPPAGDAGHPARTGPHHPRQPVEPHPATGRDTAAAVHRPDQRADRPATGRLHPNGRPPRLGDPAEARRHLPAGGRRPRPGLPVGRRGRTAPRTATAGRGGSASPAVSAGAGATSSRRPSRSSSWPSPARRPPSTPARPWPARA